MVFAMWPITFAAGYPILIHMFTAYEPRHRCYVPGCDPEIGQGGTFYTELFQSFCISNFQINLK